MNFYKTLKMYRLYLTVILLLNLITSVTNAIQSNIDDITVNNEQSMQFFNNPKIFNIGAVLSSDENIAQFLQAIEDVNYEPNILPAGIKMYGVTVPMDSNPIKNVQNVCGTLFPTQVYAIIIDDSSNDDSITFTTSLHNVPTIGISNRQSLFSDKTYETYMRTISPYFHQADVWIEIINYLNYNCVTFIYSNNMEGRTVQRRFENLADQYNIKIENIIEYKEGSPSIITLLQETIQFNCRVFVLYTDLHDSDIIFQQIKALNMTSSGYVWLVSEQSLESKHIPDGSIGTKLQHSNNKELHIRDSIYILGRALRDVVQYENLTKPPIDCSDISGDNKWESGIKLFTYLKRQNLLYGKTGTVAFDEKGDRINSDYEIFNIINGEKYLVGNYNFSQTKQKVILTLNEKSIIWPGYEFMKPLGYKIKTHLRVATIAEKPFVWVNQVESYEQCKDNQIPCPRKNSTTEQEQKFCCEGYCIDLLKNLASNLNFTYSLHQVEDNLYGGYSFMNGSQHKIWTGLVGELVYDKTDMVVAPLTINPERSLAIQFTKPFKYQGFTILEKKQVKNSTLTSFLQPFENQLWVMIFVTLHLVGLALFLLDRFSPFGRYKLPNCDITEEDALNLSSALWFAWGVLLNSGIGEGSPRSFGGRLLGMVWAGFAMIVVASYTANLAAFLVLDRPEQSLSGINDERLRNPTPKLTFATVKESAVDMYFKRQIELSHVYSLMQKNNYANAEEAISAIKTGALKAFIWDSARLEFEASNDCNLITSGDLFGRSGYAIGLQKQSNYWAEKVTLSLLGMHESGFMEDLDNKWIFLNEQICEDNREKFPATLSLRNMVGMFILVAIGIFGGIGLILLEIFYKKNQIKKQRRLELARNAVDKWKEFVEKKRTLLASFSEVARQRYKNRQQFLHEYSHEYTHRQPNISQDQSDSCNKVYVIGTNEIDAKTDPRSLHKSKSMEPRHRPVLTRGSEFESFDCDTSLETLKPFNMKTDISPSH